MVFGLKSSSSKASKAKNSAKAALLPKHAPVARPRPDAPVLPSNRQILNPETLLELRYACAMVLKETGPSEEDYAVIINQPDPLDVYKREKKEIRDVRDQASASQTSLSRFSGSKSTRKRDSKNLADVPVVPRRLSKPLPPPIQTSKLPPTSKTERASKPLPMTDSALQAQAKAASGSRKGSMTHNQGSIPHEVAQPSVRPRVDSEPKPVATAYAENPRSSKHDSRSTTYTNDDGSLYRRDSQSTAHTSAGFYDSQPWSSRKDSVRQSPSEITASGTSTKRYSQLWMEDEFERRRERDRELTTMNPDYAVIPTLHPEKHRPQRRQEHDSAPGQSPRHEHRQPPSRSSSIMDNIRDGIRDYVKPRPSVSASRASSRAESRAHSRSDSRSSSRPPSRGSFSSSRSWLRGAASGLRRKGSWSSFRSNSIADDDSDHGNRKDKRLDLNRSLPPLPGLDQYKEPKKHIAQLMTSKSPVAPAPAPNVESPTPAAGERPPVLPQLGSFNSGHSLEKDSQTAQSDTTFSPSRSVNGTVRKPRIPFSDDNSPPNERVTSSTIQPVEPGWLDSEVQRRIQGRLSPALSNDAAAAVVSTAGPEPTLEELAERRREDDIRRIARRPIAQGRQGSTTSQVSQARSLSALGGPRAGEHEREQHDSRRAATSLGHNESDHDVENVMHGDVLEANGNPQELDGQEQHPEQRRPPHALPDRTSSLSHHAGSAKPKPNRESERTERAWHQTREFVDAAAAKNPDSRVVELRLPASEVPPKPPSKSPPSERKAERLKSTRKTPAPAPAPVKIHPIADQERAPAPRTAPLPSTATSLAAKASVAPPPRLPAAAPTSSGRVGPERLSLDTQNLAPAALFSDRPRPSGDNYEALPDASLRDFSSAHNKPPMLTSQQRWGTQQSRSWGLGASVKRSPSIAGSNPQGVVGPGEGKNTSARTGSGGNVFRRGSVSTAVGPNGVNGVNGHGHHHHGGSGYTATQSRRVDSAPNNTETRRAVLGRVAEGVREEQLAKKSLRNRLSRLLGGGGSSGGSGGGGGGGGDGERRRAAAAAHSRSPSSVAHYQGEVRTFVAGVGQRIDQ